MSDRRAYRLVFFGTPAYAVPTLKALARDSRFDVALVVTQPDREAGRGRRLAAPPVKLAAEELGLPLYQPASLKGEDARASIVAAGPDVIVVAAYGLIFGARMLDLAPHGCVNLHASLLPRYRGAAPVTAAVLRGDRETGVTLMRMERGLDTGPIIAERAIPVAADDTTLSLTGRLATLGAELVREALPVYLAGDFGNVPQPKDGASLVRPLVKADGWIDWDAHASQVERHIRAMWDWPRAFTSHRSATLQVHRSRVTDIESPGKPGTIHVEGGEVRVACGEGTIRLEIVQMPGGSPVAAAALVTGRLLASGERLGVGERPSTPGPLITELAD
jgi:methionyl-tRNA formyltransferase